MKIKIKILSILCLVAALEVSLGQHSQDVKNVAIFIHQGVELFDFAGPGEVFVAASRQSPTIDFNVYTVAADPQEITSQTFLKVTPNYTLENCPDPDIIILPGGATGIPLRDQRVIDWIKAAHEQAEVTLSVCTGAFLLGKAELLEGLKATTHWGSIESLRRQYPNTEVLEETKFVDNGKIITSGGVSSGTEGSLHLVSRIAGKHTAEGVARYIGV
jgi:transcriptional regulator GlxA family with amidase domain